MRGASLDLSVGHVGMVGEGLKNVLKEVRLDSERDAYHPLNAQIDQKLNNHVYHQTELKVEWQIRWLQELIGQEIDSNDENG